MPPIPPKDSAHPERVFVLPSFSTLGDVIVFFTAFDAVRKAHPKADIVVAYNEPSVKEFFCSIWQAQEFYQLPKSVGFKACRFFAQKRFNTLYEFGTTRVSRRFIVLARLVALLQLRRCKTIGYQPFARYGTRHGYLNDESAYDHGARIVRGVGLTPPEIDLAHIAEPLPNELQKTLGDKPYIVFVPVAGARQDLKCWSAKGFIEIANFLQADGYTVVVTGNKETDKEILEIVSANQQILNFAGKTSLGQFYTLMQGASACLAIDTGGGHIASAAGTPLLSLFSDQGPESPRRWAAPKAQVLLTRGLMQHHLPAKVVYSALADLLAGKTIDEANFPARVRLWSAERDAQENKKKILLLFRNAAREDNAAGQTFSTLLRHHQQDEIHCLCDPALVPLLEQTADSIGHHHFSVHPTVRDLKISVVKLLRNERKLPKQISRKTAITQWHHIYDLECNRHSYITCLCLRFPRFTRSAKLHRKPKKSSFLPQERVLVFPPYLGLGDIVIFSRTFAAIRNAHPQAEIVVGYRVAGGLKQNDSVERLLTEDALRQILRAEEFYPMPIANSWRNRFSHNGVCAYLVRNRFSTVYEFGTAIATRRLLVWARLVALLQLRPCKTIGYQPFARYGSRYGYLANESAYHHGTRFLENTGLAVPETPDLSHLKIPLATDLEKELGTQVGDKGYVVFVPIPRSLPGYKPQARSWCAQGFAEVARLLQADGYTIVATGSSDNAPAVADIVGANQQVLNFTGRTSLAELYTLIQGAVACLAVDTGGGHLAATTGTPVLSLFSDQGHESPRRLAPPNAQVLFTRGLMADHLPAQVVYSALCDLLAQKPIAETNFPPRIRLWSAERDTSENRKKILLLFRNALGEVVLTWPVFQAILQQHLQDEIHCLADPAFISLVEQGADALGHKHFSVYPVERVHYSSLFKLLRSERKLPKQISRKTAIAQWHRIYDLERNRRSRATSLTCRLSRFTRKAKFYGEKPWAKNGIFKPKGRKPDGSRHHASHSHLKFLQALELEAAPADFSFLEQKLAPELEGAIAGKKFALLIVGSSGGTNCPKRWTTAGWAGLADKLHGQGVTPLLIGTAIDAETATQVAAQTSAAVNLVGKTNFAELYSLAAQASCIVSGDTGAGHLAANAAAARHKVPHTIPVLSLFGEATDPERWCPPSALAIQHKPLHQLKAETVWDKLYPLLPERLT